MSLSFAAPQFLWALLSLPLIVLLHFIRARKRRQEVSALFLWRKALELAQARRRFSPSWLLLLQLAFAALASLALSQPSVTLRTAPDRVLVVDASASMAARDSDGVRLEKAIREAEALIGRGSRVGVVRAGLDAVVVQPPTANLGQVRSALRELVAADREADLERALELAENIAEGAEVHLFTDQPLPAGADSRGVFYHSVAGDGVNLGISTFDIGIQQAYVAVVSTSPRPQEVTLSLLQDGREQARTSLLVPARGQANITFPLTGGGFFEARISAPPWDALDLDNVAFAGSRELLVVVDREVTPLLRALDAVPGVRWRVTAQAAQVPAADVRILTGVDPATLERGNYLIFAAPSQNASFQTIRDFDQSDPLLRFVDLRDVIVGVDPAWQPDEDPRWEVLARTANLTPVLRRLEAQGLRVVQAGFHPSQTDMVFRPAFPALITNVLRSFRGEAQLALGSPLPAGSTFDGQRVARAYLPGVYQLPTGAYSASLLSAAESRLPAPVAAPLTAAPREQPNLVQRRQSAALWLVLVAVLVLVVEWLLWARSQGRGWVAARSR